MKTCWVGIAVLLVLPVAASGQAVPSAQDVQDRLRALEEQVQALQAEVSALKTALAGAPGQAAAGAQAPATTPAAPVGPAATPSGGDRPAPGQLPVYGVPTSKVFNPDIGVIGNFLGAAGESRGGGGAIAPLPGLSLQESEASLQAIVDPYARADFFLAFGEEGVEVEEGYVTFPTVPGGLLVKAGRMRANFGRLNAFHNHTLPWVDRPLVMFNLLGGSTEEADTGLKDVGVSVSRLLPVRALFVEATGELFRGESGTLFQTDRRRDVSMLGRLRAYADLTDNANLETGVSYVRGPNDNGGDFTTALLGVDVTFRWKPLQRAIYRSFVARTELIWSRRDEPAGDQRAFGMFASADYQFGRRWFAGGRVDWSERARDAGLRDRGFSAVLTYWPSEFSQLRGQYRRTRYASARPANEVLFQILFTIGAHGAHAF